ncbi:MAG: TCP-1/cpn60 chaperonin family protein [Patescibacteria group bacterium]
MRTTITLIGQEARAAIQRGVNAVYRTAGVTLGPNGRNALLYRTFNRGGRITNDGYTVAECQEPKDPCDRVAAQTFRESCKRTNERVGDGTTTTVVVGGKLYETASKLLAEGSSMIGGQKSSVTEIKKSILASAEKVKEKIKAISKKIEGLADLEKIAVVSVEDEKIGQTVAKMAWEVGADGYIDVLEGYKGEIETETLLGMRFPAKVPHRNFVNEPGKFEMVAKDCAVLITNYALTNVGELANLLNPLLQTNPKIILISGGGDGSARFSNEVLVDLFNGMYEIRDSKKVKRVVQITDQKGQVKTFSFEVYPVACPSLRTEQLEDLAVYCGANLINKDTGRKLSNIKPDDLGFLAKLVVKDTEAREDATALGGKGTKEEVVSEYQNKEVEGKKTKAYITRTTTRLAEHIAVLKGQLVETREVNFKKLLERRIASVASATGVIRVGGSTDASTLYWKLKIEDAVNACKSALRGGYVEGGGLCLKKIAEELPPDDVLKPALLAPYEQIQAYGPVEITPDIIDPMEAIYYSVEHAAQVVANLITVEVITQEMEDPIHGEGELAIAKALYELVLSDKVSKGQIKESEREMERDNGYRMLTDEKLTTDELIELSNNNEFPI